MGGAAEMSASALALAGELARLQIVAAALGDNVLKHGPLTGRGRARAAVNLWLSVVAQQERLAARLGLQRHSRRVEDLAASFREHP